MVGVGQLRPVRPRVAVTGGDHDGHAGSPGEVIGSGRDDESPGPLPWLPRRWRILGAVAVAAAVAAWLGPGLLSDPQGGAAPRSAASRTTASARPPAPLAPDRPVRGDLAGDAGFVAAVLRRVRTDHADVDRVLFAGRLPGGARVAFVGRDRDEASGVRALDIYALRIPPGAAVEDGAVTVVGRGLIESTALDLTIPSTDDAVVAVGFARERDPRSQAAQP